MGGFKTIALTIASGLLLVFIFAPCSSAAAKTKKKPVTQANKRQDNKISAYAGSSSCRECHDRFYQLWSTSFHGLAMQVYSGEFSKSKLLPQPVPISIGDVSYQADIGQGDLVEKGAHGERRYPMQYAMGGKYAYYFLTTLDDGRLQTLPVAYDTRKKEWFDTALSGVRHFPGQQSGNLLHWKETPYTFDASCRDCHVSQRKSDYDLKSGSFRTSWKEPGINCETCHGPSEEHNRAMRALPKGKKPADYKIIRTKTFTPQQHSDSCNSCHAKSARLTSGYLAPESFFDHFDLITLENPDYYPDGRDLGENYTMTSWMLNPCSGKSSLHCVTCHTSSGRYRFRKPEDSDKACLPCHAGRVKNVAAHSHHPAASAGSRCIACHMPKTEFARMSRSDHSLLPPTPAVTIRFNSPNACNICHSDKDAVWADQQVRQWHPRDYQAPILKRAELIDAARNKQWQRLPEMLAYITDPDSNALFSASLIRLFGINRDPGILPVLLKALSDPAPLMRTAAVEILAMTPTPEVVRALITATGDKYRTVRVAAAGALSNYPEDSLKSGSADQIKKATEEYLASLKIYPANWAAHFKLGNYYLSRDNLTEALPEYEAAARLNPKAGMVLVNKAIVESRAGDIEQARADLQKALQLDPGLAIANYNLGLLTAGQGGVKEAEEYFKAAFRADPRMVDAAFSLCIIAVQDRRPAEAIPWCRKTAELQPDDPKFSYSLAILLRDSNDVNGALTTLSGLLERVPTYGEAYLLMGELLESSGRMEEAARVYRQLLIAGGIRQQLLGIARQRLSTIEAAMPDVPGQ